MIKWLINERYFCFASILGTVSTANDIRIVCELFFFFSSFFLLCSFSIYRKAKLECEFMFNFLSPFPIKQSARIYNFAAHALWNVMCKKKQMCHHKWNLCASIFPWFCETVWDVREHMIQMKDPQWELRTHTFDFGRSGNYDFYKCYVIWNFDSCVTCCRWLPCPCITWTMDVPNIGAHISASIFFFCIFLLLVVFSTRSTGTGFRTSLSFCSHCRLWHLSWPRIIACKWDNKHNFRCRLMCECVRT